MKVCLQLLQKLKKSVKNKEITSFPGEDSLTDCTVSLDGSWQKREHDSLDGIATAINRLE